jgi:hypothetical protein
LVVAVLIEMVHAAKTMNHFTGTLVFRDYVPDRVRAAKARSALPERSHGHVRCDLIHRRSSAGVERYL